MKRIIRGAVAIFAAVIGLVATGCKTQLVDVHNETEEKNSAETINFGEEVIYGETFSLHDLFNSQLRSANINQKDMVEMVYFSVLPTSIESVQKVNDVMGGLNPFELNRAILQPCDADRLIVKTDNFEAGITDYTDLIRLDIPYYYIATKEQANELSETLEGFSVIDDFFMLADVINENDETDYSRCENARWLLPEYPICGTVTYTIDGVTVPAYGLRMKLTFGPTCQTGKDVYSSSTYDNQALFIALENKRVITTENILSIIDLNDVTTFQELYDALIKDQPGLKKKINECFTKSYKPYGNPIVIAE